VLKIRLSLVLAVSVHTPSFLKRLSWEIVINRLGHRHLQSAHFEVSSLHSTLLHWLSEKKFNRPISDTFGSGVYGH
jgi:hypothetical protein